MEPAEVLVDLFIHAFSSEVLHVELIMGEGSSPIGIPLIFLWN